MKISQSDRYFSSTKWSTHRCQGIPVEIAQGTEREGQDLAGEHDVLGDNETRPQRVANPPVQALEAARRLFRQLEAERIDTPGQLTPRFAIYIRWVRARALYAQVAH